MSDAGTGVTLREERSNRSSHGVYVQGDFAVATNLHVNGGVRYDRYGHFDPAFSPRVGLIYNPLEGTTLKALYGTAFRAPSFLELILSDDLEPEEISAYELVYEQEIGRYLRSTVSGFYNRMEDLILFTSGSFQNVDAESRGIEAALEGAWTWGMRTRLSYTIQEVENRSGSLDLPDSPQQLVKLHLSVPVIRDKLFAGIELHYMSARPTFHNTTDGFGQPLTVQGVEADDFTVVTARD